MPPEHIAPHIKERLVRLERITPTIEDERAAITIARELFATAQESGHPYNSDEQRNVVVGTLFTDIGKSGPLNATPEQSELISRMFAIENRPKDEVFGSIDNFLSMHFGRDAAYDAKQLQSLGLDTAQLSMRDFYDCHTKWTLEIISNDGVPKEAIPAAAAHHHLRGDNPYHILNGKDEYTDDFDFGRNHVFGREEKLVCVLDMYDAYVRRGHMEHRRAMEQLQKWVDSTWNGRYAKDAELTQILKDLDATMLAPMPS